jgi:hypothetical protein
VTQEASNIENESSGKLIEKTQKQVTPNSFTKKIRVVLKCG